MTQQIIDIGVQGNDGTGDSIRTSFQKVNQNFSEIYAIFGGGTIKFSNLSDAPSRKIFPVTSFSTVYNRNNGSVSASFNGALTGTYAGATLVIAPGSQNGTLAIGQAIFGTNIPSNTIIQSGSGLSWTVAVIGGTPTSTLLNVSVEAMTSAYANTATVVFANVEPHASTLYNNTSNTGPFAVGQSISVSGLTGTGAALNGLQVVTAATKTSVSFSSTVTQFQSVPVSGFVGDINPYNPNQVIMVDTSGNLLTARNIVGAGGIKIDTSSNNDLIIQSTTAGLIGDTNPILSASIDARNSFTIARLPDPSQLLVDAFNALNPTDPTTIDELAISKGYADRHYIQTLNGAIVGPLTVRAQPALAPITDPAYDPTLTGNYIATEAMQRKDVVYRGGDSMTGALTLSDHPAPMAGQGTPNGSDDLQAATKFYVDNSTYYSGVNLYVSTKGDDLQSKTPPGREGRAWQYAYRTLGAAALQADNLISLSSTEPGPYRQTITWTNLATGSQTKSAIYNVSLSGGNSATQTYKDAASLLESNKAFIQYETVSYLNKKYVNSFTYDKVRYTNIIDNILTAVGNDLVLSSLDGTSLTTYNTTAEASWLFNANNTDIVTNQLSQIIDGVNYAKTQLIDYAYNTQPLETYIGQLVDAITYDLILGSNYQTIQAALGFNFANTGVSVAELVDLLDSTIIPSLGLLYDGATVTIEFDTQTTVPFPIGSYILVQGFTPTDYNGVHQVTASSASNVSFSSNIVLDVITSGTVAKNNVIVNMLANTGVNSTTVQDKLKALATVVVDLVQTGIVPTPVFPSQTATTAGQYSAANLLFSNIGFIQSELIAYITSNYPNVSYNHTTCERDIKYVVWGLIYDVMYNGNSQTVASGLRYWTYASTLQADPVTFWTSIYSYLDNLVQSIINNTLIGSAIGSNAAATSSIATSNGIVTITLATPNTTPFIPGQYITVAGVSPSGYNGTYVVISGTYNTVSYVNSTTGAQTQAGTVTGKPGVLYQQSVKQYTNETYANGGTVSKSLHDNITTFVKIVGSVGVSVTPSPTTLAGNPTTVTVGSPTGSINITVTYPTSYLASFTGFIQGLVLSAENPVGTIAIGQTVVAGLVAPGTSIVSINSATFPGYISGTTLHVTGNPTGTISIGMMLTSTDPAGIPTGNVVYITSGNSTTWTLSTNFDLGTINSPFVMTGTSYTVNVSQNVTATAMTTADALRTSRLNIENVNNTNTTNGLQYLATQFINTSFPIINNNSSQNTGVILNTISSLFGIVTSLLQQGIATRQTPTFNTPVNATPGYTDFLHAQQAIIANIPFITAETLAWMKTNASTIGYISTPSVDASTTRDLGYLLEAIAYDVTYSSNDASVRAAAKYWVNGISQITGLNQPGEACYQGLVHAQSIVSAVIISTQGAKWSPLAQNSVTQVISSAWTNTTNAGPGTKITSLFTVIKDIISNNTADSYTTTSSNYLLLVPSLSLIDNSLTGTKTTIDSQRSIITVSTLSYLDTTYKGGFNYNEATCLRDLGLIVDAEVIDLLTGGNFQSVNAGKSYYKNTSARGIAIGSQLTETLDGITFARDLAIQVLNQTTATRYQSAYVQILDNTKNATGAISSFTNNYNIILSIIRGGFGNAPTASQGTGIYTITFDNGALSANGGNGYVDQGGNVTVGVQSQIHIIPGKILVGNSSGATAQIVSYQSGHDTGHTYDTVTVRLVQPGFFQPGETLDFGETVSNQNITIFVETGIYYEDYPIKIPANVTITGDDFRRTIIRPLDRISQSPWRTTFFYRDSVIDALQTGLIDFSYDYAVPAGTTATISGINSTITITLGNNIQALQSWVGYVFMDATSETGTAGKAVVLSVSGNLINAQVIYPFTAITTYNIGGWHLYSTINYGRHYLTNPLDATSVPKNNKEIDVFLCNDATRIKLLTAQGHGGFMMVLDPTGQIKTKSPYAQESASFAGSLGTGRRFAGGQFVDGFTGRLSGTITNIANSGKTITVTGAVNSGLDLRAPQVPCAFYVAGNRYQINDVINWVQTTDINGNITGGVVTLTLDNSTPFLLSGIYNSASSVFSNLLGYLVTNAGQDMATNITATLTGASIVGNVLTVGGVGAGTIYVGMYLSGTNVVQGTYITANLTGTSTSASTWSVSYGYAATTGSQTITGTLYSNYKTIVGGLTYLQPQNYLTSLGQLAVQQGIQEAQTLISSYGLSAADTFAVNNNLMAIASIITNGASSAQAPIFPGISLGVTPAQKATNIIQTNKQFIAAEIASWIGATYNIQQISGYNSLVTQQDATYLVDAITYDIMYGGNSSVFDKTLSYYYTKTSTTAGSFTGHITGTTLYVDSGLTGTVKSGQIVTGVNVIPGTTITGGSGNTWTVNYGQTVSSGTTIYVGTSNYTLSNAAVYSAAYQRMSFVIQQLITNSTVTVSNGNQYTQNSSLATAAESTFTGYIAGNTLTVSSLTTGTIGVNQVIVGTGIAANTYIVSGAGSTWTVSGAAQTVGSSGSPIAISSTTVGYKISNGTSGLVDFLSGYVANPTTYAVPSRIAPTISNSDYTTLVNRISTIQTTTLSVLDSGANLIINIEMGGNKSMLANDFTQVNDLGYGVLATNASLTEQVSTFTYYCYTAYWALNGAQIRSVAGSNANGQYGLRASGYDVTELPNQVNLSHDMVYSAHVYKQGEFIGAMVKGGLNIYITNYQGITPQNTSEVEIDHTAVGGGITRYEVSTVSHTDVTVNNVNVLNLTLSTTGTDSTSTTGLAYPLYDGQVVTIRVLQNFKLENINNVKPVRPSTALQFTNNLGDIYRIIAYNLIESTGEPFGLTSGTAILSVDSSFNFYKLAVDPGNILNADTTGATTATVLYGGTGNSTSSYTLTVYNVTGTLVSGQVVGGIGFAGQTISTVTGPATVTVNTVQYTGVYTITLSAYPTITPVGPVYFNTKTQGSKAGDNKIAITAITSVSEINQINKGIWIFGWLGRTHRIIGYTAPTTISQGSYATSGPINGQMITSSGTTLIITGVIGTISKGQIVTSTTPGLFNGTQYVAADPIISIVNTTITAQITLNVAPTSTPSAGVTITFGTSNNGYLVVDPNPIYNNSATGTSVLGMQYVSQAALPGSTTSKIVTFNIPYNATSTGFNLPILPPVDSVLTISGNSNTKYNGQFQVVGVTNISTIYVNSVVGLSAGMKLSSSTTDAVIADGTIIQSVNATNSSIVVSPACWIPAGASLSAQQPATLFAITPSLAVGSGYTLGTNPDVIFSMAPGKSSPQRQAKAVASVNNDSTGSVNITIIDPGYGYTDAPTITLSGGSGSLGTTVLVPTLTSNPSYPTVGQSGVITTQMQVLYAVDPGTNGTISSTTNNAVVLNNTSINSSGVMTVGTFSSSSISTGMILTGTGIAQNLSLPILGISFTSSAVTFTVPAAVLTPFAAGQLIQVSGVTPTGYNGTYVLGSTASSTFSNTAGFISGTILTLAGTTTNSGNIAVGASVSSSNISSGTYITAINTTTITGTLGTTLSGVAISGTAGQFTCTAATVPLVTGQQITISGAYGGGGSISGYANPTTYVISATNGSTTFTLQTTNNAAIVTTTGTPTGLTYTQSTNLLNVTTNTNAVTIGMVITGTGVTASTYITGYSSGVGGTGTYTLNQYATGTPTTGTNYTVNLSQSAASAGVSGILTTVTYPNTTNSSTSFVSGAGTLTSSVYTYISSNISGTGPGSTWQTVTNQTGFTPAVASTSITGTANLLTASTVTNLQVGNQLTFGGNITLGGLSQSTTYYITAIVGNNLAISASYSGAPQVVTSQTATSGQNMTFNSPSFAAGAQVGIKGTPVVTPVTASGVTTYSVAFTIASSLSVTNGAYYTIAGNTNTLYNGSFPTSTATGTVAANGTLTLVYQYNPNGNSSSWGATTACTVTANTASGTSSTLGLARGFSTSGASTIRAGYPAGSGGQITVRISTCRATGHDFLDIGTGGFDTTNYPNQIYGNPTKAANSAYAVVEEGVGRVFHVSTDQNGIFRVGRFFEVDQGTGTVTFAASIALSNLDGLGFKRGVVVSEFSTDSTMTENAPDIVPVQSAVRGYLDLRLGLDASSNPVSAANLIGPGYLPLNGGLSMKNTLNMGNNFISNLYMPVGTAATDAANRGYVDSSVLGGNSIFKLKDAGFQAQGTFVSLSSATLTVTGVIGTLLKGMKPTTATGSYFTGQYITNITASGVNTIITLNAAPPSTPVSNTVILFSTLVAGDSLVYDLASGQWKNAPLPTGDVALTYTATTNAGGTLTSSIQAGVIYNSMVNASAAIAQSKLAMQAANAALSSAPGTLVQSNLGLATFNSNAFTVTNGWVDHVTSTSPTTGVLYAKIQQMSAGTVLANLTGSVASPTEYTASQVLSAGGGVASSNFTGAGVFTQTGQGTGYSITPVTQGHAVSSIIKSDSNGFIDVVGFKINGYSVASLNADGVTLQFNTPASAGPSPVYFMTAAGTTTSNAISTFTGTVDIASTSGTLLTKTIKTDASNNTVKGQVQGDWSVLSNSNWDVTSGTLKSNTLTAINSTSSSPATVTGYWKLKTGTDVFDATLGTLYSTTLNSGVGSGTISGTWSLGSGVNFSQGSGTITQTKLTTGAGGTAGTITGQWAPASDGQSSLIASSVTGQTTSATTTNSSSNTGNTLVLRNSSGNFYAGYINAGLGVSAPILSNYTVSAIYNATGSSGTNFNITGASGTIYAGMVVNGVGFTAGQTVQTVNGATNLTLSAAPNSTPSGTITFNFVVISSTNPVNGSATFNGIANAISGQTNSATITASVSSISNQIVLRDGSGGGEVSTLYTTHIVAGTSGGSNTGSTTGNIQGTWTLTGTGSQLQATYADLAEWYSSDMEYEPGTILVFGGDAETTTTATINDTRLAGVVTTDPAYTMNQGLEGMRVCIALIGRVPCKVIGRVKKGDMLTTSATPGYAVKALNPTLGAIIGKALEDKDYGEAGVIEIAVGRA